MKLIFCPFFELDLFTSSIRENNAYIYTSQPYGRVDNQFRYRAIGNTEWTESEVTDSYYRYLSGLTAGEEYEFQVAHLCQAGVWTDWSITATFTTRGGTSAGACDAVVGDRLYNSSISADAAYTYTPQPYGNVANQFRYRSVGSSTWISTDISTLYYRYLRGLSQGTEYEFQVAHECSIGQWSDWSTSKTFRTLTGFSKGDNPGKILPKSDSVDSRQSMLEQTTLSIFPNPVVEVLRIESNVAFDIGSNVEVMNLSGQTILRQQLAEGQNQVELEVAEFAPGIYLIKYDNGYEVHIEKFMKN